MRFIIPLLLIIFAFTIRNNKAFATTYYLCDCETDAEQNCIPGDDSNSGLTADQPWQSISKLNSFINSLEAGDEIRFARGGAWVDAAIESLYNFNTSRNNPIVFDSYMPSWGGFEKPILTEARKGKNLFNFADGGNADHDEGYIVKNLDLRGGGTGQWAIFAYNDVDYIRLENLEITAFGIGVHCAGANSPNSGADTQNQNMTLLNSTIRNCSEQGFLGGGDSLIIEGCYFENNGFAKAVFNHNIYLTNGNDVIVRNNELYHSAVINDKADGVSLVIHGTLDNLLIEGNYVHEDLGMVTGNAWGIAVDPGYASAESFTNLTIRGNLVVNMYNVGIGIASAPNAIIENNIVVNEAASNLVAIAAPDRIRGEEDLEMTEVHVRNNSIFLRNSNLFTRGILVGDEGKDHVVVSNAISIDSGNGLTLNLEDQSYESVDYNIIELVNDATWGGNLDKNEWSALREFDLHSIDGDPEFTELDAPVYNLKPLSSSPTIDAGHPQLSSTTDYDGIERTEIPDIGAYELFPISKNADLATANTQIFTCFPNPTIGKIVLQVDASLVNTKYYLNNFQGKRILTGNISSEKTLVDLTDLNPGIYSIGSEPYSNLVFRIMKL